ncbi:MAG: methylase [Ilumatobacteraceae bacterium]|nr:methylase [Ilumatobacteraceae bacterium]
MSDNSNRSDTERYTHGHHESVLRSHTWRTVDNSAAYLATALVPGATVLDVGCGPGTITVDMAARVAPGKVIGVDAGADVIAQAQQLAAQTGVSNVDFRTGDAYALGFADDTFDVVHAHQTLQHVADPVAVLREMHRVAKPGGVVAARDGDYAGMVWYPQLPGLDRWMDTYQRVARANGGEPDAGRRLRLWATQAGFTDITSTGTMWCFASDADRTWWGSMWADRVRDSIFATQAVERGVATQDDIEMMRATWLAWIDAPGSWFEIPNGEILCRKAG